MDYIRQNRVMGWSVVVLVGLNCLALGALWWTRVAPSPMGFPRSLHSPMPEPGAGPDVLDFLTDELGLDAQQTLVFQRLRGRFFKDNLRIRQDIHTLKQQMMRAVFAQETDPNEIKKIAQQIGQLHMDMEMSQFEHLENIKALCQPDQRERLMRVMDDVMAKVRPGGPGPGGPGPDGMRQGMGDRRRGMRGGPGPM